MITSLRLKDFKNFADETLRIGPFTVIVGANASGKSNIRDAFRFLHGVGRGYSLAEIIGGKYGAGGQMEWEPIRGAANEIIRINKSASGLPIMPNPGFGLAIEQTVDCESFAYAIEVSSELGKSGFRITYERLQVAGETVYERPRSIYGDQQIVIGNDRTVDINLDRPALVQILEMRHPFRSERKRIQSVVDSLASMRFIELSPDLMREPVFPSQTRLGNQGQNLPAVLKEICADPKRKRILTDWIGEFTPTDVRSFAFLNDPSGRIHLKIEEPGREISAYSASDGTLRFLAMLATLLGKDRARLHFIEEIETGIHPTRLWLLLDLIEKQTAKGDTQVITTSHSPNMLTFANDTTFENISVVCRLDDADDAIIRPVAELPNAVKLRASQGLGRLHASGWMEDAVAFIENDGEECAE